MRLVAGLLLLFAAGPAVAQALPATAGTEGYDARVRQSFAAAESFQGPLDGGWTLSGPQGALFALQVSERDGKLEAAWRDLRRPGAVDASGFVETVERTGGRLTLRFSAGRVRETAVLTTGRGGVWSGDLDENGRRLPVTLAKTAP